MTAIAASPTTPQWRRVVGFVWRELRVGIPLCTGIAVFISFAFGDPLHSTWVHSLCIGLSIQALIEAGRYGIAHALLRRRPGDPALQAWWPGWGWMAPWIVAAAFIGYYGGSSLADQLVGVGETRALFTGHDLRPITLLMAITLVASIGTTYFFQARSRLAVTESRVQAAQRAAAETQLKLLESQLEPHMLFNTLANLRVLIGLDPLRAQAMLDRLIAFLRATLDASRSDAHSLAAEFERIGDYLELMRVRMGPRLHLSVDLPADAAGVPVPPLLLQPLVENAITHGLEPKVAGGRVELSAQRLGGGLRLVVRDTGVGLGHGSTGGTHFGLEQVRRRLAALHGDAASLTLESANDAEGGCRATVWLPIAPSPVAGGAAA